MEQKQWFPCLMMSGIGNARRRSRISSMSTNVESLLALSVPRATILSTIISERLKNMTHMAMLRDATTRRDVLYRSDPLLVIRAFRGRYFKIYGPTAQIDFDKNLLESVADLFVEVEHSLYGKPREDIVMDLYGSRGDEISEVLSGVHAWAPIE